MEKISNITTFLENIDENKEIDKQLFYLLIFTYFNRFDREIINRLPFVNKITKIKNENNEYIFKYNNKEYSFSVFSDFQLQEFDKKILSNNNKNNIRKINCFFRTLKLASSMDLILPKIIVGNSCLDKFYLLIEFEEKGIKKVIDYERNLVIKKEDYYELFNFNEFNVVDKYELYNIFNLIDKFSSYRYLIECLLFTKEMFKDLSKFKSYKYLNDKYDFRGMNLHNYVLFGNNHDYMFF